MIQVPDHSLLQQIENYRIRLIAPQQLTETDFRKFSTNLGLVLHFIKYSKEKEKLQLLMQDRQAFQALDCTAAMVINTCTRAGLQFDSDEGAINMCKALDDMREESRQEGRQEGRQEATRNLACSLLRDGTLPLEKIAQLTEISLTELHAMKQTYSA